MKLIILLMCSLAIATAEFDHYEAFDIEPRIIKGENAVSGQFPWQVSIGTNEDYRPSCGGCLIHPNFVLTAAHCIHDDEKKYYLKFGILNYFKEDGVKRIVTKVAVHEEFDLFYTYNDIALMYIEDGVELNDKIQTITLASRFLEDKEPTTVSGWGYTENGRPTDLKYVELESITNVECKKYHKDLIDTQLCCQGKDGKSACSGDSGGPLVQYDKENKATLVGIVSFGSRMGCETGEPVGFMRVEPYYDWVLKNVKKFLAED